ncbi:COMM domain-containing protein [Halobacteriovorax marinus]|nr:hypothetical protein [Halobacteriovorax marinus]
MKKLSFMFFLFTSTNLLASDITFRVDDKKYELKARGASGQGLFKDGKFIKFFPVNSRQNLESMLEDLDELGIPKEHKTTLSKNFNDSLKPASDEELIATSIALSKVASEALSEPEVECNEENGQVTNIIPKPKHEETIYCECEMPEGVSASIGSQKVPSFEGEYWDDYSLLGEIKSSSLTINTTNDNHLHGVYGALGGGGDGNDRGRTFGLNIDYKLVGDEGEFRTSFESVIFTELNEAEENRFYINDEGEFLQNLIERNRLDLSLRKKYDVDKYYIAGIELEQITDDGNISGPIQQAWHKLSATRNIQYDNQDFRGNEVNLTLYGGLGREWVSDLGNWKCTSRLEGTLGHNILDTSDAYAKVRGEVELNSNELFGGTKENPFVLVSLWASGSLETKSAPEKQAGIKMSFPVEVGKWEVKPHVGFSIKDEKEDRYFTQKQSTKLEPESHIGITFSRKF